MSELKILSVASEIFPLIKTGGLGDVTGALPGALAAEGILVRSLVPGYPAVVGALTKARVAHGFTNLYGAPAKLLHGMAGDLDIYVLDAPHLFARYGNPYTGADGVDWADNAIRFAALGQVAAWIGLGSIGEFEPDIVHCHDWQTGLAPAYIAYGKGRRPGTVMTIHNIAFQGQYPAHLLSQIGLPEHAMSVDGVEYYGGIGYLKAGIRLSDRVTTVSPTYATEMKTPEWGMGLQGLLQSRADMVSGILNGIDVSVWDPARDSFLAAKYDIRRLNARARNKSALQVRMGLLEDPRAILFGLVTRLSWQKGLDLFLASLPAVLAQGGQVALLGTGDRDLEDSFLEAARKNPGRVGFFRGYDEPFAHLIQGGSDVIVVPSRFEPCGLTQLCALRYGAIPLVARVGGLADTVIDANEAATSMGVATGLQVAPLTEEALSSAIRRATSLYRNENAWRRMQLNGMKMDVSWRLPAAHYASLYRDLAASRAAA